MSQTQVLYVGGTGRSGSTMLANVLGEVEGMVSVGEVRFLFERGLLEDRLCGCGEAFSACPYWSQVLARLRDLGVPDLRPLARQAHQEIHDAARLRRLPEAVRRGSVPLDQGSRLGAVLPPLYRAIAEVAGSSVVVDSSKLPTYARLLADLPELDVAVVHLVRDPRAAAFSWQRRKEQPDRGRPGFMEQRGVAKSAGLWVAWNRGLEALFRGEPQRYARLTYEEFLASPEPSVRRVLEDLGLPSDTGGIFADPTTVRLSVNHTVAGNPARLRHGLVPMRLDDEWRSAMPARDRRVAFALTAPVARRYGYR